MGRDIVKVRRVGKTLVVTLTRDVLTEVTLEEGDRVVLEPQPPRRIIISKETEEMPSTQRLELELDLLMSKKAALDSEADFLMSQHDLTMPVTHQVDDEQVFELTVRQLNWERARLEVEISEKKLTLFEAQGA